MFDRDQFISVEGGLLSQISVEALAETGMLQQTTRDWDKSVEVKQQVIDYFSRTPALQKSIKLTRRKFCTIQAVPDSKI